MNTEVLIVGAGPTGLALACQLIRYGVDFVIIDKNETTTPHSKAIGVQARTLEIYEQIGLAENLIAEGTLAEGARMIVGGKIRGEISFRDFGKGMSPYPFVLFVEQGVHESILYDFIKTHGKDVRWQTEVESFTQNDERVTAQIKSHSGEIETIQAKYLVGCDGAKSLTRHSLGLEFSGGTFERLFYVADVQIDWDFRHGAFYVCLAKTNVTAFFPMRGAENNYRIVGTFPEGHDKDEGDILYEEVERQIVADTELDLDITGVNWFSVYKVHSRSVNKFSKGRCFLAGDSAHIHTPAGAQGMNTGIQDGYNLAWKLALALKQKASPRIQETYNEERLPNAKRLVKTTDRFFLLGASKNIFASFVRTRVAPYVANFVFSLNFLRKRLFPLVSQIGINYRESSLSVNDGNFKVKAGDRMPYFEVEDSSIYDRLREPTFHLLLFSDGSTPVNAAFNDLLELVDVHSFPLYPNVAEIFGMDESFTILLRPDNYIGLISEVISPDVVQNYLAQTMGR
jgi:2-polyprenyl-6-methoxyphenol hydroxylase-like FAD-dependent oxidoreductase